MDVFIKTEIHDQKIKLLYSAATHVGLGVIQRESKSKPPQRLLTAADLRITGAVYATSFRLSVHARRVQHRQGSGCQVVRLMRCGGVKTRSRDSGRGKSANSLGQQLQLLLLVPTCAGFTGHKG